MANLSNPTLLIPDWPVPASVCACVTTRQSPQALLTSKFADGYADFNLALHVGDDPHQVNNHRQQLAHTLEVSAEHFAWISQVHGVRVVTAEEAIAQADASLEADAVDTATPGLVCTVLTADCLPVLLCDAAGTHVSAVHAGWRGLADGVIEQAVKRFPSHAEILAWLGPAIGPAAFEVGEEVRQAFLAQDVAAESAFEPSLPGKWRCDLYALARQRLAALGVTQVFGGTECTFADTGIFYSFRRDGSQSGRMASCIWLTPDAVASDGR